MPIDPVRWDWMITPSEGRAPDDPIILRCEVDPKVPEPITGQAKGIRPHERTSNAT